jgi:hypothetical protein
MIIHQDIPLDKLVLADRGKSYDFERPSNCLRCKSPRLWGHGFVLRYYDGYEQGLYFKRWRCPDCGCIITTKPTGYWPRHHSPMKTIIHSLIHRIKNGHWDYTLGFTRQRQGNWLRAVRKNVFVKYGIKAIKDIHSALQKQMDSGKNPVFRTA